MHAGGGYDKSLPIASNFKPNGNQVDVLFKTVPRTDHYSLTYIGSDGHEWTIFQDVPFSSLNDYSPPAQETPASAPPDS